MEFNHAAHSGPWWDKRQRASPETSFCHEVTLELGCQCYTHLSLLNHFYGSWFEGTQALTVACSDIHFLQHYRSLQRNAEPGVPKRSLFAQQQGHLSQMSSSNKHRIPTQHQENTLKIPSHHSNGLQMGWEASCHFLLLASFLSSVWNFMACFPY